MRSSLLPVTVWKGCSAELGYIDNHEVSGSPMEIECAFFGPIQEAVGTKTATLTVGEDMTIRELAEELIVEYEALEKQLLTDNGDIRDNLVITVNKRQISHLDGESTGLSDGDTVRITTSIQGGADN